MYDASKLSRRQEYWHMHGRMNPGSPFYLSGFVEPNVKRVRSHFNQFFDCSMHEAEMLINNFCDEMIHVEFAEYNTSKLRQEYTIFSDYGWGRGDSLKQCMHRWRNIDDQDDSSEFAVRSRALGAVYQPPPSYNFSERGPLPTFKF